MALILSICALPTAEDRDARNPSIVKPIADAIEGPVCLLDGPGSDCFNGEKLGRMLRIRGKLFGKGIETNIEKAIHFIMDEVAKAPPDEPITINCLGFSRGAVTCLGIANALQQRWNIEKKGRAVPQFNIIGLDPVAGLFLKYFDDFRVIPAIVKNYIAFLALDENRMEFKPQDLGRIYLEDPSNTAVIFLPIPGNHTHAVYFFNPQFIQIPNVIYQFVKGQLVNWGVKFKADFFNEPQKDYLRIVEDYAAVHTHHEFYNQQIKSLTYFLHVSRKKFLKSRSIRKRHEEYVNGAAYFINQHHREIFKKLYPALFNYYFEHGLSLEKQFSEDEVLNDLRKCQQIAPISYQQLIRYFEYSHPFTAQDLALRTLEKLPRGGPTGNFKIEKFSLFSSSGLKNDTDVLAWRLLEIARVYQRERRVELKKNKFHHLAEKMKQDVLGVLNNRDRYGGSIYYSLLSIAYKLHAKLECRNSKSRLYRYLCLELNLPIKIKSGLFVFIIKIVLSLSRVLYSKGSFLRRLIKSVAHFILKFKMPAVIPPQLISPLPVGRYTNQYEQILKRTSQFSYKTPYQIQYEKKRQAALALPDVPADALLSTVQPAIVPPVDISVASAALQR